MDYLIQTAVNMTVKLSYPDVKVDIILPNEISETRLQAKMNLSWLRLY